MPVTQKSVELAAEYAKQNIRSEQLGSIISVTHAGGVVVVRWGNSPNPETYTEHDFVEKVKDIAARFGDAVPF